MTKMVVMVSDVTVSLSNCEPSGALHLNIFEQPE